ncbi:MULTISPECIES: GGDEF domain-containing protein [unclassified Shewanella]|uniref:GGDEF domain-containing protein n=1 Tax=unclassified Shewanella TaxID=196818 RepID=UPI00354B5811
MSAVHPKLIEIVVEQTPRAMIAMLIVSIAYISIFISFIPITILLAWFSLQLLLAVARYLNIKMFKQHLSDDNAKGLSQQEMVFIGLNLFQAFTWMVSSVLIIIFAPQPFELVSFVVAIGIITAATLSMTSLYKAYLVFFFAMIIPQVFIMFYYGEHQHIAMVVFAIIYIPATILLSKSMYHSRLSSIEAHEEIEKSAEEFRKLSIVDNLTNAYNRRYFFETSKKVLMMALRDRRKVSMLMFDIDYFKKVNDTHGHQTGDYVLVNLAKNVNQLMRESDIFARIGGEEFAILLNNTSMNDAKVLAERVRAMVETSTFEYNNTAIHITISIGLSEWTGTSMQVDQLYAMADQHLYLAKENGRNCCYPD